MQKKDKIKDIYSLSPLQKGMLFHSIKDPQSDAYFEQVTLLLEGGVNPTYLAESIQGLVQKYDMFRSVFRYKKVDPVQVVLSERKIDLQIEDLTQINEEEQRKFIEEYRKKDRERGFDLSRDILLRFTLFQTAANRYELLWSHHHILMDGWCTGIVFQDLFQMYQRRLSGQALLPEVAPQYSEYIRWLKKQDDQQALAFWKEYLQGFENLTGIPRLRSGNHPFKQEEFIFSLGEEATQKLTQTAQKYQVTLNTVVQTIWGALLQKYNNTNDATYGVVVSGRPAEVPHVEQMVGLFSNTIPIRIKKEAGKTFGEVLKNVQQTALEAEKYGYLSLADIQANAAYTHQLLDHILAFENFPMDQETFNQENVLGFAVKDAHTFEQTHYDLTVLVIPGKELIFKFMYNESVYSKEYLNLLELNMKKLVSLVIAQQDIFDPATEFVSDLEKDKLLTIFNCTDAKYPREKTIHELFQEQVDKNPDQVALVFGEAQLTYGELNEKANQMARGLRKQGILPDQVIGLLTDRSLEMIIAILAIFKAGGAYMPIDPSYPSERIQYMLADSRTHLLLVQKAEMIPANYQGEVLLLTEDSWMDENTDNLDLVNQAQDLAYVMYTSGSTGKPKGNLTTHQNIVKTIINNGYIEITPNDRLLQLSNYAFDGSTFDIYSALLNGASLVLVPTHVLMNPTDLASVIQDQHITVSFMTTSLFNTLVELDVTSLKHMRKAVFGGEKASIKHVEKALDYLGDGRLVNGYGPTETTVFATTYTVDHTIKETGIMPIGRPLNNTKVFILGADNQLQPIGALGELCVSGEGIARGYLNLPELTADRFVENPFVQGERMYRTGDLARWLPDGSIEYVGRIDEQVKIRGHRIELGEIEARLLEHPAISETVLLAKQDEQGHSFLCAYLVTNGAWSVAELRKHIKETLPDSMVPSYFIEIEKMPLTSNGKADKRALPEPDRVITNEYVAAENETEEKLVQFFQEILAVERVGTQDTFFELGGHSLKAMMLVSRIHKELEIEVPLKEVFARQTVKELAAYIRQAEQSDYSEIQPAMEQEYYPVSNAQRRMYVVQQMRDVETTGYNMPFYFEMEGALEVEKLSLALKKLIERHESLRTSFHMVDDELMQKVHAEVAWEMEMIHAVEEEVQQLTDSFMRPFDLAKAPLFRAGLIQINPKRHLLMLDMHHIISDGVSMNVLFQDITQLYQGIELSPLKIQYKDFAVWQQGMAQVVRFQEQERYWLNQFSGDLPILEMVTDYPRPAIQQFDGDSWSFEIDAKVLDSIKQLSAKQGTTLYMTLLAIYQILLAKYTRQNDIIVGTPIAGRPHADTESIVGMFVNTLALRGQPKEEQSFISYLSEVKENVLQAYDNADHPFEELVEKLHLQRDMSRHPLFDTMFVLQNMDMSEINISGLKLHSRDLNWKNAKFDMTWMIAEQNNLLISVEYSTSLFKHETIQRLEKHFTYLVEQVAKHPDCLLRDLELTTDEEKQHILTVFNDTATDDLQDLSICHLFEQQVQRFSDRPALVFKEKQLTYSEFHAKVNQLARVLRKKGVLPDQAVGLITDRSIEMMIGIFAILKAGGAYMPIDPSYPIDRIEHMLEDSRTKLLLVQKTEMIPASYQGEVLLLAEECWMHEDSSNLELINKTQDLAYVMYTSGSTGKPKGNLTTHQNILTTIINNGYIEIVPTDRLLQLSNYAFDGSTFDIYSALLNGATLVLVPKEVMLNPMELAKIVREQDITVSFMTTSLFHTLVELDVTSMKSMRKVVFGGEKASYKHVEKALDYLGEGRLVNGYGPTETTVFATTYTVDSSIKETGIVPIGRPLNNTSVYVLNENNQLQPVGVPGELCVGGAGIARGYLNRPELTAERFVENPFVSGDRMYRTGDLARWLPDGGIEYLGRMDEQVKVRGYRIELGEIETRLLEHPSISAAVLLAKQDEQGHSYLCAYIVANGVWTVTELRKHLSEALPEYMVPTYFVELEQIPFTSNGKVNKRALPEPEGQITSVYVAPETETEAKVAALFQEILGVERVGTQDMFFELGGHSLKAMMLVLRMNKELGIEVPLKEVFAHPTVKELAATIDLLDRSDHSEIEPAPKQEFYPVSSAQRRMYVVQHLGNVQTTSYNMPLFFEVEGALEIDKLHLALERLVERHESLRTSFHMVDEELMQQVHEDVVWDLEIMDGTEGDLASITAGFIRPFDLSQAPLFRAGIVRISPERFLFMLDMHHIISDGVSTNVLFQDITQLYQGKDLPPLTIQYKDYAVWQQADAQVTRLQDQESYWLHQFAGEAPVLEMPTDFPRPAVQQFEGDEWTFEIDADILSQLKKLSVSQGSTLYMTLLAAYQVLLAKYTGQDDIVVGSPIAGRAHADVESIVGMFVNTLALRGQPAGEQTFISYLAQVKEQVLQAYANAEYPFEKLVEKLDLQRDMSRHPLFDTMFTLQNMEMSDIDLAGLTFKPFDFEWKNAKFDMDWTMLEDETLKVAIEYSTSLYTKETISRMAQHFTYVLQQIIEHPAIRLAEIKIATLPEIEQILTQFNDTRANYPDNQTIHSLFEQQVERTPEQIAVVYQDQSITYRELNERANRLACCLIDKGIQRNQFVAIMVDRSIETVIGMMGILKAGGAYVPIDPDYPLDRKLYILEDSHASLLLFQQKHEVPSEFTGDRILIEQMQWYQAADTNVGIVNTAQDLAYMIYTSGSTGQPKGVIIDHQAVCNLCLMAQTYGIFANSRVLQFASFSFDASVGEVFHTLTNGATLYLMDRNLLMAGVEFVEWLRVNEITSIPFISPSALSALPYEDLPALEYISTGGEALPVDLVRLWGTDRIFLNAYGPTETTVDATIGLCTPEDKPHIGKPVLNKKAYIINPNYQLQPIGVPGELCIGGVGIAPGYWNRPELTREKFVDNPFAPGERMYKTGDLARWLPDGTIEFLGRMDGQVKIRGFRIELGEIEARLNQVPSVKQAVVLARSGEQKQGYLCAYLVTDNDLQVSALRKELSQTLPDYMIPSFFIKVDKIPVTVNGKIDKKALPKPEKEVQLQTEYVAPTNPTEEILVQIWQKVLGMERVGIVDNFFELGGHSIKAMILASNIYKELKIDLPLREIFKHTTIKEMARFIDGRDEEEYVGIQPAAKQEYYPVSSAQKRMYVIQSLEDKAQGTSYNMPSFYKMKGSVDAKKLEKVFQTLIDRHESLRTSFHMIEEQLVQKVHEQVSWKMDMKTVSANDVSRLKDSFIQPFDISTAPLFRVGLLTINKDEHILMMDVHHIVGDGVSTMILFQELIQLYQGQALPEVKIHYKDYAVWQLSQQDRLKESENFWMQQFSGELPVLELPTDYSRPPIRRLEGDYVSQSLRGDLHASVKAFMKNREVTLYMVLLATYNVLLHKYTNQRDIIVGTPVSDRPHPDVMSTVGMFVNTLAVRNQLESEQTFEGFLANVKNKMLEVYGHQEYPFEDVIEKVKVQRDTSRHPLFDTMFGVQNLETSHAELPDWGIEALDINWTSSKFDMSWMVFEADGLEIGVEYSTNLFERNTIQRMIGHFEHIIEQIMENPQIRLADIQLATEDEKVQILEEFNHQPTKITYDQAIQNRFEEQAMKTPDAVALVYKGQELTYRELNQRSNQMARTLREHGVGRDQIIAVMINRSHELIISILAVLKAGGAYLPIDPTYPLDRIEHMLEDSQTAMLLTQKEIQIPTGYSGEVLFVDQADIYHEDATDLSSMNQPADLAYIIYTSGSTGKSKGVMIEHRSLHNLIHISHPYKMGAGSRVLQFASSSFDASVAEIFPALLTGSTLYIEEKEELLTNLVPYLLENQITTVALPPSLLRSVPYRELPALECIVSVGEACTFDIVQTWGQNRTFINGYGPTESTVCSAFGVVTAEDKRITIGKPFPNQKAYIINENQQIQPIGVPGELCIAGAGLSRGYLNRPELTQEKFVNNPFAPGERLYKTGDVARWLPDGNIEYVGRMDDQVKVRGNRVELGEVTSQLLTHPSITEAVVVPIVDTHGATTLCAYFIEDKEVKVNDLRHHLAKALPEFMIPAYFIKVDHIPLTGNGKVNKQALPDPSEFISAQTGHEIVAPSSQDEEILVQVWEEVLQFKPIGVEDNFFERGGDSIKALQIVARLSKYNRKLDSRHIFKNPTISMLAPYLEQRGALIEQDSIEGEVPLTPIQSWFFEQPFVHPHHFNQSMLLPNEQGWDRQRIEQAFTTIVKHHDALRMKYQFREKIIQENQGIEGEFFTLHEVDVTKERDWQSRIEQEANQLQASFDLTTGPFVKLGLYHTAYGDYLLIVVHHLLIDGVSWRILLEDFQTLYEQKGELPAKTTSFKTWAVQLEGYARSKKLQDEASYWKGLLNKSVRELPTDKESSDTFLFGDTKEVQLTFDINETQDLLANAHHAYKTKADDLLLAALVLSINEWTKQSDIIVNLEGHGRETIVEGIDLSRTIGWFTTIYPVLFEVENHQLSSVIKHVKETLRNVPNNGIGFGILQHMSHSDVSQSQLSSHHITFNYLGQMGEDSASQSETDNGVLINTGDQISPMNANPSSLNMTCLVMNNTLHVTFDYNPQRYEQETMERLADRYKSNLKAVIDHCIQREQTERTPSDFSTKKLSLEDLDDVFATLKNL